MNRISISISTILFVLSVGFVAGCEKKSPPPQAKSTDASSATAKPASDDHDHAGDDKHDHDHDHADGDKHDHDHDDHGHGEEVELGTVTIAAFTVKVAQQGKVEAGKDAAFEFEVTGGTGTPNAVRAWIGTQDGAGSTKAKADAEDHGFHAHIEAPSPMPAASKLWIEIEDSKGVKTTGSIALNQ